MTIIANVTIEKGIPLPESLFSAPKWRYEATLTPMEVGDSFAVTLPAETAKRDLSTLRATLDRYGKKLSHKYATRKVDDGNTVRVWRTA